MGMKDLGQGHVLAAVEKRLHERARIDLAADRPIAAHRDDVLEFGKIEGAPGDAPGGILPERLVEGVAAREPLAAKPVLEFGRGERCHRVRSHRSRRRSDPGNLQSRWAPYVPVQGPGRDSSHWDR
jgi:hypothetical protein